jgi:hypothetical protein
MALKMLSQWRGRMAHVWNSATDGMQGSGDGDDTVDDRTVDDLSAQVLRDLMLKHSALDPDAAGGSAAYVRAKQVVEQLDAVYGAPMAPGAGGGGAVAIPINAMRHDVVNGDECAAMAKRLREAVALAPQTVAARADGAGGDGSGAVAEPALDDSASAQLNAAQNAALKTTMQWLKDDAAYRSALMMRVVILTRVADVIRRIAQHRRSNCCSCVVLPAQANRRLRVSWLAVQRSAV